MTAAEIRRHILELRDLAAGNGKLLDFLRERMGESKDGLKEVETRLRHLDGKLAEIDTRVSLLEKEAASQAEARSRDAEARSKRQSEARSLRMGLWIAVVAAVLSFAGSVASAYLAGRPRS